MKENQRVSNRVKQIPESAIHEMTRLSKQFDDVAFLSWAKPTSGTPEHINNAAIVLVNHLLAHRLAEKEAAFKINIHYAVPALFGKFNQRLPCHQSSVIHQNVDGT